MYVLLAIATGGLVSLMIQLNGDLQLLIGAIPALIVIHLSGLAASGGYVASRHVAVGHPSPPRAERTPVPWWFALAGVLGVGIVFMSNEVYRRGGVLLTLMGTLAGQTLVAQVLEMIPRFGGRKSPQLQRLLSLVLILPGALIIGMESGVGLPWVLLSWTPGAVLMLQAAMNSANTAYRGTGNMLLLNYGTALAALALMAAIGLQTLPRILQSVPAVPFLILVGGGILGVLVVSFSSFLLNRISAVRMVLGVYTGQIAIGIVLDMLASRPLQPEKVAGIVLVVLGLLSGETKRLRKVPS